MSDNELVKYILFGLVSIPPNLAVICIEIMQGAVSCVKCWHVSCYIELHFQKSSSVLMHLVFSGCVSFKLLTAALEYNFSVCGSEVFSFARAVMQGMWWIPVSHHVNLLDLLPVHNL